MYKADTQCYEVPNFPVPSGYPELRDSAGLDRSEAEKRLRMLGPNLGTLRTYYVVCEHHSRITCDV